MGGRRIGGVLATNAMARTTVILPPQMIEALKAMSEGNLLAGIRKMYNEHSDGESELRETAEAQMSKAERGPYPTGLLNRWRSPSPLPLELTAQGIRYLIESGSLIASAASVRIPVFVDPQDSCGNSSPTSIALDRTECGMPRLVGKLVQETGRLIVILYSKHVTRPVVLIGEASEQRSHERAS
jgi:hypothetical protein